MENSVSSAALNAAREQLDAAEAAREVILLQHIANGVIIDSRTVQIAPDVVIARVPSFWPAPSCAAERSSVQAASSAPTPSLRTAS